MSPLDVERSIVLLGAGASRPAGIPTAFEMTNRMLAVFGDDALQSHHQRATRTIVGALQMAAGLRGEESISNIDIEQVLNAARLLATRFDTDLSPFVGVWHPFLEELERLYTAIHIEYIRKFAGANASTEIIQRLSERPGGRSFHTLVGILTGKLMKLTWLTDHRKAAYFRPLLEKARDTPLVIATLNYDNAIEITASALCIPCHTLGDWQRTAELPECAQGIDLLKLHGSTNWRWSSRPRTFAGLTPSRTISEISPTDMPERLRIATLYDNTSDIGDSLGVIFGGGNKLTAEGPFLDVLQKFKRLLWERSHLLTVGYSFRDVHINYLIEHWFAANPTAKLTIVGAPGTDADRDAFCCAHKEEMNRRIFYDGSGVEEALRNC